MNKTIQKIESYKEKWLTKAINEAQREYEEAEDWFKDTGDGRRFRTMSRCEDELKELRSYQFYGTLHPPKMPNTLQVEQYKEYWMLKQDLKTIRGKFHDFVKVLGMPWMREIQEIDDILEKYRYMNIPPEIKAEIEAGIQAEKNT